MKDRTKRQKRILAELENSPLIERACKRVGVARSTFYRWCEDDRAFYYMAESARLKGRERFNDLAESKLIENINAGHQGAIQFWLTNNSKAYQASRIISQRRMKQIEDEEIARHKEIFETLDYDEYIREVGGDPEIINEALKEAVKGKIRWLIKHDV